VVFHGVYEPMSTRCYIDLPIGKLPAPIVDKLQPSDQVRFFTLEKRSARLVGLLFFLVVLLFGAIKATLMLHAGSHAQQNLEYLPLSIFFHFSTTSIWVLLGHYASQRQQFRTRTGSYLPPGVYVGPSFICIISQEGIATFICRHCIESWSEAIVHETSRGATGHTCLTLITLTGDEKPTQLLIGTIHTSPPVTLRKIMKEWLIPHHKLTRELKVDHLQVVTRYIPSDSPPVH